jgi:hypothetical protein
MSTFAQKKNSMLAVLGLAVAAATILIGLGFVGGSGSSRPAPKPKLNGPWRLMAEAPEPIAAGRTAVWTGNEMIVAGTNPGSDGTFIHSTEVAESYNPATDTWRRLATPPDTQNYCRRSAVWTGKEMLVWGCSLLAYDPAKNEWRRLPDPPTRQGIVAWTGHELIGWGGGCCGDASDDGSAYNPETNTWRKLAAAPVSGQQSPAGAWTGHELVIVNGQTPDGDPVDGTAYNPTTDTWRRIAPAPSPYDPNQAVFYDGSLFVLGVRPGSMSLLEFNLENNRWEDLGGIGTTPSAAVLARNRLLLWGGEPSGLLYQLGTGAQLPFTAPRVARRTDPAIVSTGHEVLVWGGMIPPKAGVSGPPTYLASGAAFGSQKVSAPLPQCCGG